LRCFLGIRMPPAEGRCPTRFLHLPFCHGFQDLRHGGSWLLCFVPHPERLGTERSWEPILCDVTCTSECDHACGWLGSTWPNERRNRGALFFSPEFMERASRMCRVNRMTLYLVHVRRKRDPIVFKFAPPTPLKKQNASHVTKRLFVLLLF
jgi:hypothetical protein